MFSSLQEIKVKPYPIVIPPPNVTGKLHLWSAWGHNSSRYHYPSKTHAKFWYALASRYGPRVTQAKVEMAWWRHSVMTSVVKNSSRKSGEWKDEYATTIKEQWGKMGLSVDYSRELFHLDEGLSKLLRKVFRTRQERGWSTVVSLSTGDPAARTALSGYRGDSQGCRRCLLQHMNYMLEKMVHAPLKLRQLVLKLCLGMLRLRSIQKDSRRDLIGKMSFQSLINWFQSLETNTRILSLVLVSWKITPARRSKRLPGWSTPQLATSTSANDDGTMTTWPSNLQAWPFEARKAAVKLEEIGVEKRVHSVGHQNVQVRGWTTLVYSVVRKMDQLVKECYCQPRQKTKVEFTHLVSTIPFLQWMENAMTGKHVSSGSHQIPAWYNAGGWNIIIAPEGDGWTPVMARKRTKTRCA